MVSISAMLKTLKRQEILDSEKQQIFLFIEKQESRQTSSFLMNNLIYTFISQYCGISLNEAVYRLRIRTTSSLGEISKQNRLAEKYQLNDRKSNNAADESQYQRKHSKLQIAVKNLPNGLKNFILIECNAGKHDDIQFIRYFVD